MTISISSDSFKETEESIQALADIERRSKTQMAVILLEEAIAARQSVIQRQKQREEKGKENVSSV